MNRHWLTHTGLLSVATAALAAATSREIPEFAVKQPLYPTMQQYYESPYRQPYLDMLRRSYGSLEQMEAAASHDPARSAALVLIPSTWRKADTGWGLYLHVSPDDRGYLPDGWEAVLSREKLIGVSPHGVGNDVDVTLRMRRTLDAMAAATAEFRLDRKNIIVGGFSGGASIAARLVVEFPDMFLGAVAGCKALPLLDAPAVTGVYPGEYKLVPEATWTALRGYERRWYFGTGTKDFNYPSVTAQEPIWRKLGLEIQTDVVGDLGHKDLPADSFAKALSFIRSGSSAETPPPAGKAEEAGKPMRMSGSVFWFIPHGTTTTIGPPGKATVIVLTGKDSRQELATTPIKYTWNRDRHGLVGTYVFADVAMPAKAKLVVSYEMNADLDDGNGMRTQSELVVPALLSRASASVVEWAEAKFTAQKGRAPAVKGRNGR